MATSMRRRGGFTLIELLVTLSIMVLLLLMVVPSLGNAIRAAKTATLVNSLPQDLAWARVQAASTQRPVQVVLGPGNCQWQTQIGTWGAGGVGWNTSSADQSATAPHSMNSAATRYPNAVCNWGAATQTIAFDNRGQVANGVTPTITISDGGAQQWTLQVLLSGLVLQNATTSY